MLTGASTSCLFPMLTEEALTRILEMGIVNTEVFLNSPSEHTEAFARRIKSITDSFGAKTVSVHPYSSEMEGVSFFGKYPRRFEDEAEDYRRYFEFCATVGADIFVFHGARSFMPLEPDFYFERFVRLRDIARGQGVRLCQENVARCHSGQPDFIARMARAIPDVQFVLDVKQAVRAKVTAFDMLSAMGKNLAHVHLSDHSGDCDCLALGEGSFELGRFANELKARGFDGAVLLELYRWNYQGEEQLSQGVKLFDSLL